MNARDAGTIQIDTLTVPRMGYGTMRLTGPGIWGEPPDREEAIRVLRRAVDLGVRAIDTAWYYGLDVANRLVAEALRPYPPDLVLITKLGGARRDDGSWYADLSPSALRAGCERDLRVLGLDSIPVTHLRLPDRLSTPFEEVLDTMLALQQEGKIQRIGMSNVSLEYLDAALERTPIATVSNAYGVTNRAGEDVLRRCEERGIPFLPYFPLAAGAHGEHDPLVRVAQQVGATPAQVALAWLLARSPVMLPIPGTSRVRHLEENVAAAELNLPVDVLDLLNAGG